MTLEPLKLRRLLRGAAIAGLALGLAGCGVIVRGLFPAEDPVRTAAAERQWAAAAWQYFIANEDPATGLVPGIERGTRATTWEIADAFAATESALRLGLIGAAEHDRRTSRLLAFVNRMPLFEGRLPNLAYEVGSGAMVSHDGRPGEAGWSAVDAGRLLLWLGVVAERHPALREYAARAVLRWDYCALLGCGTGARSGERTGDSAHAWRDERAGYVRYALAGFRAWGFTVAPPAQTADERIRIEDVSFAVPLSSGRAAEAASTLVTLPAVLAGIETGWRGDAQLRELSQRLLAAQQRRYERAGILTARTEHQGPQGEYYVDAVFAGGYPWNTFDWTGAHRGDQSLVSVRAAFPIWALAPDGYGATLQRSLQHLYDARRGFYEGRFEASGGVSRGITATTNAVVLESIAYRRGGVLAGSGPGPAELLRLRPTAPEGLALCLPGPVPASCAAP